MKAKVIVAALTLCLLSVVVAKADNPHMGVWKLNESKSHFSAGATKNNTVLYEAAGTDVKVIVDGTNAEGAATHNEWTGKFNGRFYAVSGDPTSDKRSYRVINSRAMRLTAKKDGKITLTGSITVSRDGKSRTVVTTGTDANGKRITNTAVYDKQ
ncbi:MAG TPA: hypothetical protein VJT71_01965 [Pyrinomonadaceae bacterium]|nr:hypothetical protein [Pyrinomonadaceae bacterium]